ncbi:YopX family protein [Staphylococcus epidermidis]|nr:YopX family protein [Staphylococcus epidermidis]
MENLRFRAWDKEDNKMVRWKDLRLVKNNRDKDLRVVDITYSPIKFKKAKLMQSTGLKDKNGVEIYEGDIVEFKYPYDKRIKTKGTIVWNNNKACFGINMKETTEQYELYRITAENYLTVIGNVHQNPELLEDN